MTIRLLTTGPFAGLPDGHFRTILADPPWRFKTFSGKPGIKGPPYPTMSLDEIKALPVGDLAANGCWLFLWTTGTFLDLSREVMRAWGFRYSSTFGVWIRTTQDGRIRKGLGKTSRKSAEFVLLGKIGSPKILSRPDEVLLAPSKEHSRKPPQMLQRIEEFCPGPRIELFARERREGWTSWGNQIDYFTPSHRAPLQEGRLEAAL
jgi:N6-adenosine-specific RNA methylase IME4